MSSTRANGVVLETDEDYNAPARVHERKVKMAEYAKNSKRIQARAYKNTIPLPLRGQQTPYYCAPAAGEMVIDYQLGRRNIFTQTRIANAMKTTTNGTTGYNAARGLKQITKLNFTYTSLTEISLYNALRIDINANVGLLLPINLKLMYKDRRGYHMVAAKGYSSNTVIFLDPYKYDPTMYGQHEVALSTMESAIRNVENKIIW